jgi:hypothetical protein
MERVITNASSLFSHLTLDALLDPLCPGRHRREVLQLRPEDDPGRLLARVRCAGPQEGNNAGIKVHEPSEGRGDHAHVPGVVVQLRKTLNHCQLRPEGSGGPEELFARSTAIVDTARGGTSGLEGVRRLPAVDVRGQELELQHRCGRLLVTDQSTLRGCLPFTADERNDRQDDDQHTHQGESCGLTATDTQVAHAPHHRPP